jgi:hypothetical protein
MALLRDPMLREDQKQTLLHVYRAFVMENMAEAEAADEDGSEDTGAAAAAD